MSTEKILFSLEIRNLFSKCQQTQNENVKMTLKTLKLRFKKGRQYNVSSKSLFVISVVLLDNTTVECTLSADSTGSECLANVSERLAIYQVKIKFQSKCLTIPYFKGRQLPKNS